MKNKKQSGSGFLYVIIFLFLYSSTGCEQARHLEYIILAFGKHWSLFFTVKISRFYRFVCLRI